jgi:hypothetical protein
MHQLPIGLEAEVAYRHSSIAADFRQSRRPEPGRSARRWHHPRAGTVARG